MERLCTGIDRRKSCSGFAFPGALGWSDWDLHCVGPPYCSCHLQLKREFSKPPSSFAILFPQRKGPKSEVFQVFPLPVWTNFKTVIFRRNATVFLLLNKKPYPYRMAGSQTYPGKQNVSKFFFTRQSTNKPRFARTKMPAQPSLLAGESADVAIMKEPVYFCSIFRFRIHSPSRSSL